MKKVCALTLSIAMLLALVACGAPAETAKPSSGAATPSADASAEMVKISVATPTAEGNPMQDLVYYFEEQVDKLLPGRVEWENYPNSAMGSEREIGEQVMDGTLDAALVGPSNIPSFAPMNAVRLQDIPFLFQSQDELFDATDEWYHDLINK